MNFLRRFMYGRNGPDHLGLAVMVLSCVLSIALRFVPLVPLRAALNFAVYVCFVYFIFRIISRNVYKRQQENMRFLSLLRTVSGRMRTRTTVIRNARYYKYMKCPRCGLKLRAPRGRGRIRVTCQQCGEAFERKV